MCSRPGAGLLPVSPARDGFASIARATSQLLRSHDPSYNLPPTRRGTTASSQSVRKTLGSDATTFLRVIFSREVQEVFSYLVIPMTPPPPTCSVSGYGELSADSLGIGGPVRHGGCLSRVLAATSVAGWICLPALPESARLPAYGGMEAIGYTHEPTVLLGKGKDAAIQCLPRVHRVASLLKRWLLGTHQGAVSPQHLDDYLDEFTLRFNRRTSASRGKLFYRLVQQAVQIDPVPYKTIIGRKPDHNP